LKNEREREVEREVKRERERGVGGQLSFEQLHGTAAREESERVKERKRERESLLLYTMKT
jgi:hypothetical protein